MGGCLSTKKGDIFDNRALDGDALGLEILNAAEK